MSNNIKSGDLVLLTGAFNAYFHKKHPESKLCLTNRLAKCEEIIDWGSEKGQMIKAARLKSGKWKNLPLEDNKYIISIFYHDLKGREGKKGVVERGVPMFQVHPKTGVPFFEKVPDWMLKEIMKKCEEFDVELKEGLDESSE